VPKKKKHFKPSSQGPEALGERRPLLSRRGKITIGVGVALVAIGFYILTFTDPAGQNWASHLCPFVILGGYAVIGIGIVLPDPGENQPDTPL